MLSSGQGFLSSPAQAGTHNHWRFNFARPCHIVRTRIMGPRLRGDDARSEFFTLAI